MDSGGGEDDINNTDNNNRNGYCGSGDDKLEDNNANSSCWSIEKIQETIELWELSSTEQDDFLLLKERLKDITHWKNSPNEVVRFLRARPGDCNAAEDMFRKMIQWRKENNVDTIMQDYQPPKILIDYYPGAILNGVDKDGDPIYVGRLGVTDGAGMLKRYGRMEILKHAIWIRELVSKGEWIDDYYKQQQQKNNNLKRRPLKRMTIIEDLDDLSVTKLIQNRDLLSLYGEIMRLDQDNYCETAKKIIIIRAPMLFRMVWSISKHFFDPGVVDKMIFTGYNDYQTILDKYIDRNVLPSYIDPINGKGIAAKGMPSNFHGGPLPTS